MKDYDKYRSLDQSSIIIIHSIDYFPYLTKIEVESSQNIKLFIYCENFGINALKYIIDTTLTMDISHHSNVLHNKYFIVDDIEEESILFMTFKWFQSFKSCRTPKMKIISKFGKKSSTWTKKLQVFDKFGNFNQCPLIFLIPRSFSFYHYFAVQIKTNKMLPFGLIPEILHITADKFNFTVLIQHANYSFNPKLQQTNVSMSPNLNDQINFDFIIKQTALIVVKPQHKKLIISLGNEERIAFAITPSGSYTNYEKLLFPFDLTTWILVGSTFGISFAIIFIVNITDRRFQNLVYGENVRMPALNVARIFFGFGQTRLPVKNFARIILMLFIFFCLIFRTCYQEKTFELLTSDLRKPLPEKIDDLFEQNYTLYMVHSYDRVLKKMTGWRRLNLICK